MKLELISHPLCPFVHRAAIMIHEKGLPFERRYIDLKAKPDWLLAISPRGKVPVLLADGVALFESAAICEFIDETHPPALMPANPFERARQRAWMEVASDLNLTQYKLFGAKTPADREKADQANRAVLAIYEAALRDHVIDPDGFGFAHIGLAPPALRFAIAERELGTRLFEATPRLAALMRRLAVRPSVTETVPDNFQALFLDDLAERGSLFAAGRAPAGPTG